jgi:acyl carrier protein
MQAAVVEESIRRFILERFPIAKARAVSNQDSLLEKGIVDSLGILEVVSFIEKEFQITVSDEDLDPENFASIFSMATYVDRMRKP